MKDLSKSDWGFLAVWLFWVALLVYLTLIYLS